MQHNVLWVAHKVPLSIWTYFFYLFWIILIYYICFFSSTPDFKISCLEICTVGARYKLSVCIITWEPGFQIIFFGCSIVQSSGYNVDNLIREFKRSHELFGCSNHLLMHCPRILWPCQNKLFNFFELMDSENTPSIFSMCTSFFSETCRCSSISYWQGLLVNPLFSVISRNRLLGCGNKIIIIIKLLRSFSFYFIKRFIKIT